MAKRAAADGAVDFPAIWAHIRVTGIPKAGSSDLRPISVSSLAWRLCLCCVIKNLSAWVDAWIDEDLHGGVKDRQIDSAIDALLSDFQGLEQAEALSGGSIDVAKFFDSLSPEQMLVICERFGFPKEVSNLVRAFLSMQADVVYGPRVH